MLTTEEIAEYTATLDMIERGRRPDGKFLPKAWCHRQALIIAILAKPVLVEDGTEPGVPDLERRAQDIAKRYAPNDQADASTERR